MPHLEYHLCLCMSDLAINPSGFMWWYARDSLTLLNRGVKEVWRFNIIRRFGIFFFNLVKVAEFKGVECKFYMNIKMMHPLNSLNVEIDLFGLYTNARRLFFF